MQIGVKENPAFSQPEQFSAAQARVDALNAEGGIDGTPIELTQCDSDLDPNKEAACIKQAVDDEYSAIVASTLAFTSMSVLEEAGIPYVGSSGITADQFSSELSFPFSGNVGYFYGEAAIALEEGVSGASLIGPSDASNKINVQMVQDAMDLAGIPVRTATAPMGRPDYSAVAATAMDGDPDAIVTCGALEFVTKVIVSLRQQGYDGLIITYGQAIDAVSVKTMGPAAEGVRVALGALPPSDTSNETVSTYLAEMEQADPDAKLNELSAYGWSSIYVFEQIMQNATSFTAADVAEAYGAATEPVDSGLMGQYVGAGSSPITDLPRAFNRHYVPGVVRDGEIVLTGEFVDAYEQVESGSLN